MSMCKQFLIVLMGIWFFVGWGEPSFGQLVDYNDITTNSGLNANRWGDTTNASAIDISGDDLKDLLISRYKTIGSGDNNSMYWKMSQINQITDDPMYTDYSTGGFGSSTKPEDNTNGFLCADFDNDEYTDVYAPHHNGGRLYLNVEGVLTEVTSYSTGLSGLQSVGGAWGDFNGDSFIDLFVILGAEAHIDEVPNGTALFVNVPDATAPGGRKLEKVTGFPTDEKIGSVLLADFDSDNDIDILLVPTAYTATAHDFARYYENIGNYSQSPLNWFSDESDPNLTSLGTGWDRAKCSAAVADYDNDGVLEVVFSNAGHYGYMENDGAGVFSPGVVKTISTDNGDVGIFDVDLDGRVDFLRGRKGHTYHPIVYRNQLTASHDYDFVDISQLVELDGFTNTNGVCLSDLNGNGFTEVFFARKNIDNTTGLLFKAGPQAENVQNDWVGIRLTSPDGIENFRCIGATVHVFAGSLHQTRIIDGGMGRASQGDFDLTFGLGDYSGTVDVEVFMPSGAHFYLQDLPTNQYNSLALDDVVLNEATVDYSIVFNIDDATEDWVFTWKTSSFSDAKKDNVYIEVINGTGIVYDGGIQGPYDPLSYSGGDVVSEKADGQWLHRVVISGVVCEPRRKIEYHVTSALGPNSESSAVYTSTAKYFCMSNTP